MTTPSADDSGVRLEINGSLATITLDRPDRLNSQSPATWYALSEIGAELPETVRVVVLRGAGRSFSAGLDRSLFDFGSAASGGLGELATLGSDQDVADRIASYQAGFSWLTRGPAITIAAVQGHAIGAGFQLALACDLRILTEDAMLTMAETSLGLVPDLTGTGPLVRAVGYSRALEICATGRRVGAAEAAALGLAAMVVPAEQLDGAVADLVAALLAAPAAASAATKQLLLGVADRTSEEQYIAERQAQVPLLRLMSTSATDR